jgi:carboxylesterase
MRDRGVLVLHGFTGTPYEVAPLREHLRSRGYEVEAPALPGHGTTPEELQRTTWRDWYAGAEAALASLATRARTVGVAGLSMGGLLALRLAAHRPEVAGIAVLAAPLWLPWPTRVAVRWLRPILPYVPKGPSDLRDAGERRRIVNYRVFPLAATWSLIELTGEVRAALPSVRAPALIVHARRDHTAPFACADWLAARLPGARRLTLERSFHLVTLDVERDAVLRAVDSFFSEVLT